MGAGVVADCTNWPDCGKGACSGNGKEICCCTTNFELEFVEVWQRGQGMLVFVGESGKPQVVHFIPGSLYAYGYIVPIGEVFGLSLALIITFHNERLLVK